MLDWESAPLFLKWPSCSFHYYLRNPGVVCWGFLGAGMVQKKLSFEVRSELVGQGNDDDEPRKRKTSDDRAK